MRQFSDLFQTRFCFRCGHIILELADDVGF
jgi:hypothetical protein